MLKRIIPLSITLLFSSCAVSETEPPTVLHTFPNGTQILSSETESINGNLICDFVYAREATGMYDNTDLNPDLFTFTKNADKYNGERVSPADLPSVKLKTGDTWSGLTVESALTEFFKLDSVSDEHFLAKIILNFSGTVELNGTLRYYAEEDHGGRYGKITFIPDNSYKGMPVLCSNSGYDSKAYFRKLKQPTQKADEFAVYTDAPVYSLGYCDDYNLPELSSLIGDGSQYVSTEVTVTLDEISLSWGAECGTDLTSARIVSLSQQTA